GKATSWLCFERPDRVAGLVTRLCDPWILSADTRRPAVFLADASFAATLRSWAEPCRRRIMAKSSRNSSIALAACAVAVLALSSAASQQKAAPGQTSDTKDELAQNFLAEHEIGRRFHIDPADLPAPKTGAIVTNRSLVVPYGGQTLQVPPGFTATAFATGLANPRRLLVLPNGDVLVAEQSAGYLTLLRNDGEGHAKWINRHVEDLNKPYGLAWRDNELLVADQDGIWSVPHNLGANRAGRPAPSQRADQVPQDQKRPVPGAYGAGLVAQKGFL